MLRANVLTILILMQTMVSTLVRGQDYECTGEDTEVLLERAIVHEQAIPDAWEAAGIEMVEGQLDTTDQSDEKSFVDTHVFEAEVGQVVTVFLSYASFDGQLALQPPSGKYYFANNDTGEGYSAIVYPVLNNGIHRVEVFAYGCQTGGYRLYVGTVEPIPLDEQSE